MPKKLLNRILPTPEKVARMPGIKYLGRHIFAPELWYVNRRSISGAVFWGLLCGFMPVPMHTLLAALIAMALGLNLPICLLMVWISNPLTIPPILVSSYWIGAHLLHEPMIGANQIFELFKQLLNWMVGTAKNPFHNEMQSLIWPLLTGLLLEALLVSGIAALSVRLLWRYHVIHQWKNRKYHPKKQHAPL